MARYRQGDQFLSLACRIMVLMHIQALPLTRERRSACRATPLLSTLLRLMKRTVRLRALKTQYPGHVVVLTRNNVLGTPGALIQPIAQDDLILNFFFAPFPRGSTSAGILAANIMFAGFRLNYRVCPWPQLVTTAVEVLLTRDTN